MKPVIKMIGYLVQKLIQVVRFQCACLNFVNF